jgi:hypothetical protein
MTSCYLMRDISRKYIVSLMLQMNIALSTILVKKLLAV